MKTDFLKIFEEFYENGIMNGVTETYISRIPKKENPKTISNFRLISLVTSLYKVIASLSSPNHIGPA